MESGGSRQLQLMLWFLFGLVGASGQRTLPSNDCNGLDSFVISVDYATEPKSLSIRAVTSLGECLNHCRKSADCQAANFYSVRSSTSPICELLASRNRASEIGGSGNSTAVADSIFRMYYAERLCLDVDTQICSDRDWLFEKIPETRLQDIKTVASAVLDSRNNASTQDCLKLCLRTEFCEAVVVKRANTTGGPDCQLISVNRHTVRNPDHYFKASSDFDLYETNCRNGSSIERDQLPSKSGCTFSNDRLQIRSSIKLYDQRMNGVPTRDECQSLCSDFRQAPCRMYMFDRGQSSCYLSHSRPDSTTNSEFDFNKPNDVFLDPSDRAADVTAAELDDCVQFDLACTPISLVVNVSTSRMFRGSFGILTADKPSCRMTVDNEQRFRLSLNYAECDVRREKSGQYSTIVSLKYGTNQLFTYKDRQIKLVCRQSDMTLDDIAVTAQLRVRNVSLPNDLHDKMSVISGQDAIPIGLGDYDLRILDLDLRPVAKVQPGDEGYLEVSQREARPVAAEVIITNLVASSVQMGEEVALLDDLGCSLHKDLIKPFEPVDGARTWRARVRFFGFNGTITDRIHFSGLIKPCLGECVSTETKCKDTRKSSESAPIRLRRQVFEGRAIELAPPEPLAMFGRSR